MRTVELGELSWRMTLFEEEHPQAMEMPGRSDLLGLPSPVLDAAPEVAGPSTEGIRLDVQSCGGIIASGSLYGCASRTLSRAILEA